MRQIFYSNGKLLITAEYVVLDGAIALALPTKFGQDLIVEETETEYIEWESFDNDGKVWFKDKIDFEVIRNKTFSESGNDIKNTLIEILHHAFLLNPDFINNHKGCKVATHLTFPKSWGLGTSSTLINNIAQWTGVDAYELLKKSFGGSGYDIACAQNDTPILYRLENDKPIVEKVAFNPDFIENLYFVYLNKKQNSKLAIKAYKEKKNYKEIIPEINKITTEILEKNHLEAFQKQIEKHELLLSEILVQKTVKENLFSDFNGGIKSLGAWGGDFVLVASKENPTNYFKNKGYETILEFKDMIL